MFFEFESVNNINNDDNETRDQAQPKTSQNYKSPSSKAISPLALDTSSPWRSSSNFNASPSFRHRRYSMHSCQTPSYLERDSNLSPLKEHVFSSDCSNKSNHSLCDLALITRKKLMLLNGSNLVSTKSNTFDTSSPSLRASLEKRFVEPDVKLNQTFTKHSNSDLRKEVLLASIQRSFSNSSDDLQNLNNSQMPMLINNESDMEDTSSSGSFGQTMEKNQQFRCDDDSMSTNFQNNDNQSKQCIEMDSESSVSKGTGRQKTSQLGSCYTPSETHVNLNSLTTFTSTTSMAGGSKNNNIHSNNSSNSCRNYIKSTNNNSSFHYSRTSSPNLTCTVQSSSSPIRNSLKKRIFSTSPSKYSHTMPYHTVANQITCNKDSIISSMANSSDWEIAFKRIKVMHIDRKDIDKPSDNEFQSTNQSSLTNSYGQQRELSELTQNFHRLKTPFT